MEIPLSSPSKTLSIKRFRSLSSYTAFTMDAFSVAEAEEEMMSRALDPYDVEEDQDEDGDASGSAATLPSSGAAYLKRVMKEADKIDNVMIGKYSFCFRISSRFL